MSCRRCDAGPEDVVVRPYAGCAERKGRVHSVQANSEPVDPEVQEQEVPELRSAPVLGSSELRASTEARKQAVGAPRDQDVLLLADAVPLSLLSCRALLRRSMVAPP